MIALGLAIFFFALAIVQLVTGKAFTQIGSVKGSLPAYVKRRTMPWHFWFLFWLNLALGAFCVAVLVTST
jgi:hypothetical protein